MTVVEPTWSPGVVRRAPYGSNPELGRHGNRARQEILDAARRLFAERGYHGTTVEAIGEASGRSGASVYQYFECKGQLFAVFVDELTQEVLAYARRLGEMDRIDAGPDGLTELRSRVHGLAAVLARHSSTFALWPVVEESEPPLKGSAREFMLAFADAVRPALAAGGVPADQQTPLAIALGGMVRWSQATRLERAPHLPAELLDDVLVRAVYESLCVRTAEEVRAPVADRPVPERAPRPAGAVPSDDPRAMPGVRRPVTARSRPTLERILAAATDTFRRNGFHGTTINDIASAAGVSHASVYTYWRDRNSLFATLAHHAAVALAEHIEAAPFGFADVAAGRAWMRRWLELIADHGAVLHIWTHEVVHDAELGPFALAMQRYVAAFLDWLLRAAPTAGQIHPGAAHIVVWSLLTDVPYAHCDQLRVVSHDEFLDVLSVLLMRGILGYR
jgi:AcrR family transcriptional regulator